MYAQYSIPAVVFSGQQHAGLEILQLVFDAVKTPDDAFRFILILEFFRDLDQFRYLVKLVRKLAVGIQTVFKGFLLF
jgi:hypothetical protein